MSTHEKLILNELLLNNFATFKDQSINFTEGFNTIIGETGSGKSLILDALQMILGSRADKKLVRKGCEFSTIEAIFSCKDPIIKNFFNETGYPFDEDEVVIKRIIYASGKTKSFLNFQTCSLQTLQKFSKRFTDLVGQFENQKLLSDKYQMVLLDSFASNENLKFDFRNIYAQLLDTNKKIDELKRKRVDHAGRLDYIKFQLDEIDKLAPSVQDEEKLIKQKRTIINLEERSHFVAKVDSIFDEGMNLNASLSALERELNSASSFLDQKFISDFLNAKEILTDLQYNLASLKDEDTTEVDIESVIEKLDAYQRLKRKFSTDTEGILAIKTELEQEKQSLDNISDNLLELKEKAFILNQQALKLANTLHDQRLGAAKELSKKLTTAIRSLRMKGSTIKIEITKCSTLTSEGVSQINFLAETNPGEGYHKIKDAASGGELSRILLAIRQIISTQDTINIFLFDEIDTGIGGETALKIGEALKKVSNNSQVIAITHLPQIAKFANKLVLVSKAIESSRTYSKVDEIVGEKILDEVMSMNPLN